MIAESIPQLYTFEEFCEAIEDGQKADLIDGVIYMASPDSFEHNILANFIQFLLDGYASERGTGTVVASRMAFRLSLRGGPEPDVAYVSNENSGRIQPTRVEGGPDIAVEVISVESRERDYVRKRVLYEEAGVPEYWIIDPLRKDVLFLRLCDGEYKPVGLKEGVFHSDVLPGFWLDVTWLFEPHLPNKFSCLNAILAGGPVSKGGDHA